MKLFHLENMQTQRTPRASAGKVLLTTVAIENKIIGGRAQDQSSPLSDHPMYPMLEAYVLRVRASRTDGPAGAHMNPTLLSQPAGPDLSDPPFAPALPPPAGVMYAPGNNFAPHMPDLPRPAVRPLGHRPVDRVVPRGKR